MSGQGTHVIAAMTRLRIALEHTAAALARPDLDALLAGESAIEMALMELRAMDSGGRARVSRDEEHAVRAEVEKARGALLRCRRLGHALDRFVLTSLEVQGRAGYGPRNPATSYAGQALDARV